ncbi:TonB-dependent receptor [Pseudoxanthomonas sangjuensis]|uniref:TonB-dependent receptor plug domain-containing protein n=1 Tax=Pseudoxanthomonas sangjuensis TaxID=1503750 RepID=UPI00139155BB|nr:TonB-dependent receptor [Pseudoxanthomonas sangjuensis]KAF1715049.1 hypothetical protein CSC71_02210 [Pseudoxanthomonas sangjuensis]
MRLHATSLAALLATALHAPAAAARADGDVFPREYFAGTLAGNAWEMLQRVPGFAIVEADDEVRGYGAARGNVLIDGTRPSSKREDISDLLKRIPAASVERIELVRSGAGGIDMAGHAVLANVVRVHEASGEGAIEAGAAASTDGWLAPQAGVEYARRWQDHALDFALQYEPELDDDSGRGRIRAFAPDGAARGDERLDTRVVQKNGEASASWKQPLAGGQLTLTGAYRDERESVDTWRRTDGEAGERIDERNTGRETEFGARWSRRLGAKTVLEALATRRDGRIDDHERSREDGTDTLFEEDTDTRESIGRLELSHERSRRLTLSASLEAARNTLGSDARLLEGGVPVALPGSDVDVAETRYEGTAGFAWQATGALQLEAAMRFERSSIAHGGDSPLQRRFSYPKPRAALRWDAGERDRLRLSLSREVGQLDFGDFVASAELDAGTVSAGNAELVPDKTWRLAASWEHHFGADAAFTLTWTHERIEDAIDRVLVANGDDAFDAPGNIGDGRRDTLQLDLAAPLDGIGFHGGRIRATLLGTDSAVTDPVTGERRRIGEEKPVDGEIELSQDLPAWRATWGVLVEHIAERETQYRFDEIERKSEGVGWTLYAERRFGARWRVRAEAVDLFGRGFRDDRDKYDGPRSQVPLDEREARRRRTPGTFELTFRREFGD